MEKLKIILMDELEMNAQELGTRLGVYCYANKSSGRVPVTTVQRVSEYTQKAHPELYKRLVREFSEFTEHEYNRRVVANIGRYIAGTIDYGELADKLNVTPATLGKLLTGEKMYSLYQVSQIAKILDVDTKELIVNMEEILPKNEKTSLNE